jgi:hypothetical protein
MTTKIDSNLSSCKVEALYVPRVIFDIKPKVVNDVEPSQDIRSALA